MWIHLTNYAINKNNPKFVFNENEEDTDVGHKRSLTSLWSSLEQDGVDVPEL
jgi:tubulin polyglutamylase TTLL6/13